MGVSTQAVVFDRDGVLTRFDEERLARELKDYLPLTRAELGLRWQRFRRGAPALDAASEREAIRSFLADVADELELDRSARERLGALDYAAYLTAFADAEPAMRRARDAGLRVGVLTNNSALLSAARMLDLAGLGTLVDVALSSQDLGAAKPAPAAYLGVAEALGVPPERCIFFDNVLAWVEGARAVGMRAYRVDRSAPTHDIQKGVVRDLSAIALILG